jgi:Na+/glutamate symporter
VYFGQDFERAMNVLIVLAGVGLIALLVGGPALAWWLIAHLRVTLV